MLGQKLILFRMSGVYESSTVAENSAALYNNEGSGRSNRHRGAGDTPDASYAGAPSTTSDEVTATAAGQTTGTLDENSGFWRDETSEERDYNVYGWAQETVPDYNGVEPPAADEDGG